MPESAIDIEYPDVLLGYLRATGRAGPHEPLEIRVLAGGVSNRTVLVRFADGRAWVLKQALHKLRVPTDWFSDPVRIHREALGLRHLERLAPRGTITPLVFEDGEHHLLAMEAVPEPHENWKTMLLAGRLNSDHVRQFARLLARVHREAWYRREELEPLFADRSFFESLRIEPYYGYTAAQMPETASFLEALIADTRDRRLTLVHGDYSPKNILVHHGRLVLLDHEVIHWGDPAFDVGFALAHLLSKAHHLPLYRDAFAAAAESFWSTYLEGVDAAPWAADLETHAACHTLACLLARAAGRSQLEYLSPDERSLQRAAVLALIDASTRKLPALIAGFISMLPL